MLGHTVTDSGISITSSGNRVLDALRQDARDFILQRGEIRPAFSGDTVFEDGAEQTHVLFPLEGVISFVSELAAGRNVEKASVGSEGVLGVTVLLGDTMAVGKSVVQVPGRALWLSRENFEQALAQFDCARAAMLGYTRSFIVQLMESVACNSLHTAEQRVSRWLLQAHDRMKGDDFQVTQEAVSQLLALRRATVNMVCTELMNAGAITYNRGRMTVRDRKTLHARSCGCYDRIRQATAS